MRTSIVLISVALANGASLGISSVASAHITLQSPQRRDDVNPLLDAPCGPKAPAPRGSIVTVFAPGESIMVAWKENVPHPGHFRIAFDTDGDDFLDPKTLDDVAATGADLGNGVRVLADNIPEREAVTLNDPPYVLAVTLPDIACEACTLQVIQVAADVPPYGDNNDVYHDCANISLRPGGAASAAPSGMAGASAAAPGGAAPVGPVASVPAGNVVTTDSGCSATRAASAGSATGLFAWLGVATLWAVRSHRRR